MLSFLVSLLILVLYAIVCALVIEIVCWAIGLFIAVPPKIKQLLYAIVGIILLIYVIQMLAAGTPIRLPHYQ